MPAPGPTVTIQNPPAGVAKVVNPALKALLSGPLHGGLSGTLGVLSLRGRKSGTPYRIVVAYQDQRDASGGGEIIVFSHAGWRVNFRGGHEATLRLRGSDLAVRGVLVEDPAVVSSRSLAVLREKGTSRSLGLRVAKAATPTLQDVAAVSPPHAYIRFTRR